MARKMPSKLASARAYYRLAARSERAGDYRTGAHYRRIAERLVREQAAMRAATAAREQARAAWQLKSKTD